MSKSIQDSILPNGPNKTITRHIGDVLHPARESKAGIRAEIGNLSDILRCGSHSALPPKAGHVYCNSACPLCANSGHRPCFEMKEAKETFEMKEAVN